MKITQFDKVTAKALAHDIEAALQAVAEKHGLVAKYKGGSFTANTFMPKLEFAVISESGMAVTREVEDFKKYAAMFDLQADDLGKSFVANGETFTVCGLKPNSPKLPVLAKKNDGRVFKLSAELVARKLHPVNA